MDNINKTLRDLMVAESSLTALVDSRIYPYQAPQDTLTPYVVYEKLTHRPNYTYDGDSGYRESTFRIDISARTTAEVEDVEQAIVTALSGFRGEIEEDGVEILSIFITNITGGVEGSLDGNDNPMYEAAIDADVRYKILSES